MSSSIKACEMAASPSFIAQTPCLSLWRGSATTPFKSHFQPVRAFNRVVVSWNASGPARIELEVDGARFPITSSPLPAANFSGKLAVDTIELEKPAASFCIHVLPHNHTTATLIAVSHWMHGERNPFTEKRSPACGKLLSISERSQFVESKDPGSICSPTSLAMVLESHGVTLSTREVADGVYDSIHTIYGNWPLNTFFANRASGLACYVQRAAGLEELESEIAAGRPAIASLKWKTGDLAGAAISESSGHLMVVIGFTQSGDVIVNDPAGEPGAVRRIYQRHQFYRCWLEQASGILYVIRP